MKHYEERKKYKSESKLKLVTNMRHLKVLTDAFQFPFSRESIHMFTRKYCKNSNFSK